MTQHNHVHIFIASVMGLLSQPARYRLFDIARDQNAHSCGAISDIVTLPHSSNYILHPSGVPVGYNKLSMLGKDSYNNTIGSIVVTSSNRRDRVELIALRTALLYSYSHDNIVLNVDPGHTVDTYIGAFTLKEDNSGMCLEVPANSGVRDVVEECVDIIMLRTLERKTTQIKVIRNRNHQHIVGCLQRDAIKMFDGNTDYVVYDKYYDRSDSRADRLAESIQQAGVGAIINAV